MQLTNTTVDRNGTSFLVEFVSEGGDRVSISFSHSSELSDADAKARAKVMMVHLTSFVEEQEFL